MRTFPLPAFGESEFFENQENATARVWSIAAAERFDAYRALYLGDGYVEKEAYQTGSHRYCALQKGGQGVFLNAYGATDELRVVEEESCNYFSYTDRAGEARFAPQITQVKLVDYGMSYVIRLADGRFIVIDGGFIYDSDCDALHETLFAQSAGAKPVIAAWILTHQHEDHFHCFLRFMEKYEGEAEIEKILFNFPKHDDFDHYPELARDNVKWADTRACLRIPQLLSWIEKTGILQFTPHTGQKYRIGDANIELLACMDDSIHVTKNGNATSLVFRMELGSQVILWTADAACSHVRLDERYGAYLKADILQVPHHGFQSGTPEAEIRTYDLAAAPVCLLPSDGYCAYTFFCIFREGSRHLMLSEHTQELIDGDEQRTLVLPYLPKKGARERRMHEMALGIENNGARTFVFSELNSGCEEDLCFTLLNMTVLPVQVRVDLYCEGKNPIRNAARFELGGSSLQICRLTGGENGVLAPNKRLPEGVPFAARFLCDTPIVVTNKKHAAAYHSTLCL